MKKIVSVILAICMVFVLSLSVSAYTINTDDAQIGADEIFGIAAVYFEDATVTDGEKTTVDLMIDNNQGFTELKITVAADAGIAVEAVANGDLGTASYSDSVITVTSADAIEADGCIAKITFTASEEGVKSVVLTATGKNGTATVSVLGATCQITVEAAQSEGLAGDVDNDGFVNTTDLAKFKIALAEGSAEQLPNADFDGDGFVNTTDLARFKLYLAGA